MNKTEKNRQKKFTHSLSLYIMLVGWAGTIVYTLLLVEHKSIQYVINYFLSYEQEGLRFRALIFFFPLMATVVAFLLHEREKYLSSMMRKKQEADIANKQLEELVKQKDLFLVRLGHDLKTPLTPLVTLLPIIRDRETDSDQKKLLDATVTNAETLKDLVIKSLKLARVKSSRELKLETINLKQRLDTYIQKRNEYLGERNLIILNNVASSIYMKVDEKELEELVYNLISNAVKYSPAQAEIKIEAMVEGELVQVSVIDSGIGLTPEQVEHIFDEFYKVDESRHELDSSGLGLSICKNIVNNHGGKIFASSDGPGKGATISFTMPHASSAKVLEEESGI